MISRIDVKALPWLTRKHIFTSATFRLLRIKIRFMKDRYFRIYAKNASNKIALYPLHQIENYLFLKNFEMIALLVTACRFC